MNLSFGFNRTVGRVALVLSMSAGLLASVAAAQPQDAKQRDTAKPLHDGKGPRDTRPEDFAPAAFSPHAPVTFKLSNGVPVMLWSKRELPLVAVHVLIHPGGPIDSPEQAGRTTLTATMLEEGARDLDATKFADTMQSLGAVFGSGADTESASVSLTVLKRNFERAAGLMADAVLRPRMEATDWERVKRLHLEDLKQEDDEPAIVAGRVGARVLFGATNAYGWPTSGTPATVSKLTLDEIKAHHKSTYHAGFATILVSGDLTMEEAKGTLEKCFGKWASAPIDRITPNPMPSKALDSWKVVIVDRPGAVQTVVRFMTPGFPMSDPQRVRLEVLNTLLGGGFTSRLNQNLREAHGYTYGAGSGYAMQPTTGWWTARASVVADKTGASLKEFLGEFARIRKGDISPEEVSKARETLKTELVDRFAGINGVLGMTAGLIESGLPFETLGADAKAMNSVTAAELNGLAAKVLPIESGVLVLVGDKSLILNQIKDLGLPTPVEYTAQGEPKMAGK